MENKEWLLYVEEINRLPKTTLGRTIWRFNFITLQTLMAKNIFNLLYIHLMRSNVNSTTKLIPGLFLYYSTARTYLAWSSNMIVYNKYVCPQKIQLERWFWKILPNFLKFICLKIFLTWVFQQLESSKYISQSHFYWSACIYKHRSTYCSQLQTANN